MIKYLLLGLSLVCLFNIAAHANPVARQVANHKEETGLGLGAILGGLIAGPPGAIIGAAGGAWLGDKEQQKDTQLTSLEKRLLEKQAELAYLQNEFGKLRTQHDRALQDVRLDSRYADVEALSRGVTLAVYFRTGKSDIGEATKTDIHRLAGFLSDFPEITLQLEAHADRRGDPDYNLQLSRERAQAVRKALLNAGIDTDRIKSYAHGESQAGAGEGDVDGYAFDRRVNIQLTLDTEV